MSPRIMETQRNPYTTYANRLLLTMAVLFAFVWWGQWYITAPWYDGLYWFVQSALIGSVADWFAVTALFRKPLGVSFHTELIPRNKNRLIEGIIRMVNTKLLTYEQCKSAIERVQFVPFLDQYIRSDVGRNTVRQGIATVLSELWERRSDREWAQWGAQRLRKFLHNQSFIGPMQQTLLHVCEYNRYESVVIRGIDYLQRALYTPKAQQWLEAVIEEEIEKRKKDVVSAMLIGLSEGLNIVNVQEMARAIIEEVHQMLERWKQPNSTERLVWLHQWVGPLQHMASNRSITKTLDDAIQQWIDVQDWELMLEEYVCPRIHEGMVSADGTSPMAVALESSFQELWNHYCEEPGMVERLEEALTHIMLHIASKSHGFIGIIIREVLQSLSTERFIHFIESKVEEDLAWIRINGAFVGGVAGLGTWLFLYYVYEPMLRGFGIL